MTSKSGSVALNVVRREWLIVLIALIAGFAVAFATARTAPSKVYTASERIVVLVPVSDLANPPKAESVVGASAQSGLIASVEESLGLDAGALRGKVSAKLDPADKTVAIISVKADSEDAALRELEGVGTALIRQAGQRLDFYVSARGRDAVALESRHADLEKQLADIRRRASASSGSTRALYEQAYAALQPTFFSAQDEAREARQAAESARGLIYAETPNVSSASTGGLRTGRLAQGLFLGLVAGVAIAALCEWWLRRSQAA